MGQIIIGIHAKLTKDGEKDIDLLVHSHYIGRSSPCVVITDWSTRSDIGGSIDSLDQIFDERSCQASRIHHQRAREPRCNH